MKKKLDQILVIDVEATCWQGKPPPDEENEIIEIGVCTLDVASGERSAGESFFVKPQHSTVSAFCTQLTTLTQAQVDTGVEFCDACSLLQDKYLTKSRTWASYGDYDRHQFKRQCRRRDVSYPFASSHINVKNLFALKHRLPREVGMTRALELLQLPLEGTHHRAGDDAWNIAGILSTLLFATGCPGHEKFKVGWHVPSGHA